MFISVAKIVNLKQKNISHKNTKKTAKAVFYENIYMLTTIALAELR